MNNNKNFIAFNRAADNVTLYVDADEIVQVNPIWFGGKQYGSYVHVRHMDKPHEVKQNAPEVMRTLEKVHGHKINCDLVPAGQRDAVPTLPGK